MSLWVCARCNTDQPRHGLKYSIEGKTPCCMFCFEEWERTVKTSVTAGVPIGPARPNQNVLEEAAGLIYGDRQEQYGNAWVNFSDIAMLWDPILGKRVSPEAVALCLLQLKVARAIRDIREERPIKRDTVVDLAGYAGCIEKIQKGI